MLADQTWSLRSKLGAMTRLGGQQRDERCARRGSRAICSAVGSEIDRGGHRWIGVTCQTSMRISLEGRFIASWGVGTSSAATIPSRTAIPPELEPVPVWPMENLAGSSFISLFIGGDGWKKR